MSFKSSGIPRYVSTAIVAIVSIIASGVWFSIVKETPTVAIRNEKVFLARSSSGTGFWCDGWGKCNMSGSLKVQGVLIGTGSQLNLADLDSYYVNDTGDTMTGTLTVDLTTGYSAVEVMQELSGAVLHAQDGLTSSGALVWEGSASGAILWVSSLDGAGLTDCDAATQTLNWDDTLNRFVCGADADTTYDAGQGLTLTSTTFSLSPVFSGSNLNLTTYLGNSGTLVNAGAGKFKGDFTINSDNGAADAVFTFGSDGTAETLTFLNVADMFEFSDDVNVTGTYTGSGNAIIYGRVLSKNSGGASGTLIINGPAISATPNDHIVIRPEGNGAFRAPKDIEWSDDADTADATGSGNVFAIPDSMSGGILVDWAGNVATAGVTGTATWQIINQTDGCDLFSTKITIDTAEKSTSTAAAAAVINTACNTFTTDDILILRTDVVQTTAAKGKAIRITIAPK